MLFANLLANRSRGILTYLCAVVAGCLLLPGNLHAQNPARDGLFLSVPNPITDAAVKQIQLKIEDSFKTGRLLKDGVIIFDFNPNSQPAMSSNYGSPHDLAQLIRDLKSRVTTMAFVSNEVTQHTVLPVIACRQIFMTGADPKTKEFKAKIGNISKEPLTKDKLDYYQEIARENSLGDLVARMIDKTLVLKKIKTADGTFFLSRKSIDKLPAKSWTEEKDSFPPELLPGTSLFDAGLAYNIRLCQALYESREKLVGDLGLPRKCLTEDWLRGGTPIVWRIEVKGDTDKGSMDSLERRIKRARNQGANFIILQLEGSGGDTTNVASAAETIRDLRGENDNPIKTVAYIPPGTSLGAATFLALACSEIVMADTATIADFSYLSTLDKAALHQRRDMLVSLAEKQGYPAKLFAASLDPSLVLYAVHPKNAAKDTGRFKLLTQEEFDKDAADKKEWVKESQVTTGQFLKIDANLARSSGTADILNQATLESLYARYGLESSKIRVARDDWQDHLAEFFRDQRVRFFLVMLGIIGLILELKMPGTAVPGVCSAICFVLFFWSYSFVGQYTMLAVLLFVLGIILLGVEIFVLPGFGFTGIAGILLVVSSLALVTLEKWPTTSDEWLSLGGTLSTFGMSLVVAVVTAMIVAWFLPSIPYANRLVLNPPNEDANEYEATTPPSLLGAIGLASTSLRPAGKAQFGDEFHDVIAEGDFVNPGQRVQVIEIEGNRIVVKEI